jgi:hypothetical protein
MVPNAVSVPCGESSVILPPTLIPSRVASRSPTAILSSPKSASEPAQITGKLRGRAIREPQFRVLTLHIANKLPHEMRFADSRRSIEIDEVERIFAILLREAHERTLSEAVLFNK